MTIIKRKYDIADFIKPQKALVIFGPRRVGKATLLNDFLSRTNLKFKLDSGDNIQTQQVLSSQNFKQILDYAAGYDLIAIDEAQQIPNIGMGLKVLVDQRPNLIVVATGSSSFDLAGAIGEPLTGRKITLVLYPFAQLELLPLSNAFELKAKLEDFLIFGAFPEVVTAQNRRDKIVLLEELVHSYMLKDVLRLDRIKGAKVLLDLLKLLAFQIGAQVSLNELATQLRIDVKTVGRYLDLFEKAFVIKRIGGFSRNLRSEVVSKAKYYFLDNWVEEREGRLLGYEFKWSEKKRGKQPKDWFKTYSNADFQTISRENYMEFVA